MQLFGRKLLDKLPLSRVTARSNKKERSERYASSPLREAHSLKNLGIRTKPLPGRLSVHQEGLIAHDLETIERDLARQELCSFISKLPREIRLMIYGHVLGDRNLLLRLARFWTSPSQDDLRESLCYTVTARRNDSQWWKNCSDVSPFWPGEFGGSRDTSNIMPLLKTCRAIYTEAIDLIYSLNNFLFQDPYTLICLGMHVSSAHLNSLRTIYIKWPLVGGMWELWPTEKTWWHAFWRTLSTFTGLQRLRINMTRAPPRPLSQWCRDMDWLEPIRQVTAPRDFVLLLPLDMATLDVDTSPSACQIIGHAYV